MTTENQVNQVNHVSSNQSAPLYYMPIPPLETTQDSQNIQPINNNSVDGSNNIVININKGYLKTFVYGLAIIGSVYSVYKCYEYIMFNLENRSAKLENKLGNLENKLGNLENKLGNVENFLFSRSHYSPSEKYTKYFEYAKSFATKSELCQNKNTR